MVEPKQEERFEYKGFPCVILFMPLCYRCGYVGLPKDTKVDTEKIDCHCGITYTSNILHCQTDTHRLWIGFDCGHYCDGYDVAKAKEYFADNINAMRQIEFMEKTGYFGTCNEQNPVRTLEYCKEQCRSIVEQILGESEVSE